MVPKDRPFLFPKDLKDKKGIRMARTPIEIKIRDIISSAIEDMGYNLVAIKVTNKTVNVMVETTNPDEKTISLGECSKITHTVSMLLDVEDPIDGEYSLEVGSPGIDRPLITKDDFLRYLGFEAKIKTFIPNEEGRKKYHGRLLSATDDVVSINVDGTDYDVPANDIEEAKLILTEELINKTKKHN